MPNITYKSFYYLFNILLPAKGKLCNFHMGVGISN